MLSPKLINLLLIAIGLIFVVLSVRPTISMRKANPTGQWLLLLTLLICFIAGYSVQILFLLANQQPLSSNETMLNTILFLGGLFVFAMVHFTRQSLAKLQHAKAQAKYDAAHDSLTKLPNRYHLSDYLQQLLTKAERQPERDFSLLLLDFKNFKQININLNHDIGDQLLIALAQRLSQQPYHDCSARLGGDKFAVIVPFCDHDKLDKYANTLSQRLSQSLCIQGLDFSLSCAMGIACYPSSADTAEILIRHADVALYQAKRSGKRYTLYSPDFHTQQLANFNQYAKLVQALAANQFEVYYHPLLYSHDQSLYGVEALIRWRLPNGKLLTSDDIIPFAEQTSLMSDISRWVLEQALCDYHGWYQQGYRFQLQINLSVRDLEDASFYPFLTAQLRRYPIPAQQLVLEITESAPITDLATLQQQLNHLHQLGVKISIDDFGTGYSSLTLLAQIPFDQIKIDQAFITDKTARYHPLIQTIRFIGHQYQVPVIAEGIESQEDAENMRIMGCDILQGYWFARPMAAASLEGWIKRHALLQQSYVR
uniref:putative bifunctional diguanylate cyclase/phosphodiesterase n=1 Tax=Thaumasiovibrio occultus TaxID=1891184 RepID=UPI00131C2CBC|nr:bifunctional diguanylate cyclase/phosphodiesterase [Thaumasiovibrio occultus]